MLSASRCAKPPLPWAVALTALPAGTPLNRGWSHPLPLGAFFPFALVAQDTDRAGRATMEFMEDDPTNEEFWGPLGGFAEVTRWGVSPPSA